MTRTRFLLALLVMVVLMQLFPARAALIEMFVVGACAAYCLAWAASRYRAQSRDKAAQAAQLLADDEEYRQYKRQLDSLRARYDMVRDGDDLTIIPQEYKDELEALHDRHQAMLLRKFGPR